MLNKHIKSTNICMDKNNAIHSNNNMNKNLDYEESDEDEIPLTQRRSFLKRTRKVDNENILDTKRRRQTQDKNNDKNNNNSLEKQIAPSPAQTPPDLITSDQSNDISSTLMAIDISDTQEENKNNQYRQTNTESNIHIYIC